MSRKVRLAVVGIGLRGEWAAQTLARREDAEVVALCDGMPAKAEWVRQQNHLDSAKVFDNVPAMLSGVDCEGVIVTTSDAHHAEAVVPALEAGRFVYCEKPLEVSLQRCRAIIEADDRAGGKVFAGHNLRYAPLYEQVKRRVQEGQVGRVLTIQADEFYQGGRTYFRRWNRLRSEGGGLWITKACHDFDIIAWLADAEPVEVYAADARTHFVPRTGAALRCRDCKLQDTCVDRAPADVHPLRRIHEEQGGSPPDLCLYNSDGDTFDHGIATIRFNNDAVATYTCNVVSGFTDRRLRVSGSEGTIDGHLEGRSITRCDRKTARTEELDLEIKEWSEHGGADHRVLDGFVQFIRGEAPPRCRPRDALLAVRMGLAARHSADTHSVARLGDFNV